MKQAIVVALTLPLAAACASPAPAAKPAAPVTVTATATVTTNVQHTPDSCFQALDTAEQIGKRNTDALRVAIGMGVNPPESEQARAFVIAQIEEIKDDLENLQPLYRELAAHCRKAR